VFKAVDALVVVFKREALFDGFFLLDPAMALACLFIVDFIVPDFYLRKRERLIERDERADGGLCFLPLLFEKDVNMFRS